MSYIYIYIYKGDCIAIGIKDSVVVYYQLVQKLGHHRYFDKQLDSN